MIAAYVAAERMQLGFTDYVSLTSLVIAAIYAVLIAGMWRQARTACDV
jgi:hypothetical protein